MFHSAGMLSNINLDQTERIGDTLVCRVTADGSNKALEAHSVWHLAMMEGIFLPDCGLYYLSTKRQCLIRSRKRLSPPVPLTMLYVR